MDVVKVVFNRVLYRVQQHIILAVPFAAPGIIWPLSLYSSGQLHTGLNKVRLIPNPYFSFQDLFPLKHAACSLCAGAAAASALVTFNQSARAAARR